MKSDAQLAERVRIKAKELADEHPKYGTSKPIIEIPEMHGQTVDVTPFELLHEVGRATVFENRVELHDYQRLWALLRYCNAFGHNSFVRGLGERILCLTAETRSVQTVPVQLSSRARAAVDDAAIPLAEARYAEYLAALSDESD
ncbi:hypothetical protein [Actinoplanes sp. NPDC026670]|uniref:hypothetical protein n=1 Tax=Actinoplanes sp. NPDC026670 TaxID=3154700 RepID=UPI0033F3C504